MSVVTAAPIDAECGEDGELGGVKLVAAGFPVADPDTDEVFGAAGEPLDDGPPWRSVFPRGVLREG
ncbi:hypothetical protein ABZY81_41145 [Streptomyces sp. NPDC006514]|uniref:hypothetical protein n=1 Tax=Streptomyces sp. NPDC006514 TaxID=3154308 RepID=UPI0033BAE495